MVEKKEERVVTVRKMNVILKCCTTWLSFCRRSRVMRRRTRRRRRTAVAEENVAEKQEESESKYDPDIAHFWFAKNNVKREQLKGNGYVKNMGLAAMEGGELKNRVV